MSDPQRAAAEVAAALRTVIAERGVPSGGSQLRALLNDHLPSGSRDHRARVDLLVAAVDDGMLRDLAGGGTFDRPALVAELAAARGLTDDTATWVVDTCAAALGVTLTGRSQPPSVTVDPEVAGAALRHGHEAELMATTPPEGTFPAPLPLVPDPQPTGPRRSRAGIVGVVAIGAVALVAGGLLVGTRIAGNQNGVGPDTPTTFTVSGPSSISSSTTSSSTTTSSTSSSTTTTRPTTSTSSLVTSSAELPDGWASLLGSSQPNVPREVSDMTELLGKVRATGADAAVYRSDDLTGRTNLQPGYLVLLVGGFRNEASASAYCSSLAADLKPYGCKVNAVS